MNIFAYSKEKANRLALNGVLLLVLWTTVNLLFTRVWSIFPGIIGFLGEGLLVLILGYVLLHPEIGQKHIWSKLKNPINFSFLLFVGFALISMFLNNVPFAQGVFGVRALFQFVLLTIIILMLDVPFKWVMTLFYSIVGMALIQSIVGIGQVVAGIPLPLSNMEERRSIAIGEEIRAFGFMDSSNTLAGFLLVAILLVALYVFMYRSEIPNKHKFIFAGILAVMLIALTLTFSRQAFLALIGCLGLIGLLFRHNKMFRIMLFVSLGLGVLFVIGYSLSLIFLEGFAQRNFYTFDFTRNYRVLMMIAGLQVFMFSPLIGAGPGMFGSNAAFVFDSPFHQFIHDMLPIIMTTVDNNALAVLVEYGIVGTALFVFMFWKIFRLMFSLSDSTNASVRWLSVFVITFGIAFLVMGTLSTAWENHPISIFFWLFLGIVLNWYQNDKHEKTGEV
ncbi:O-antigen ligase family protein [Geomicrobium sp. JSM 1781026]|uniref:O-antigen ligase family protein n=1 Tax=Geomicrobium sp. JSM 1781026 TaxID=3344580 RepID=UPI0035C0471D